MTSESEKGNFRLQWLEQGIDITLSRLKYKKTNWVKDKTDSPTFTTKSINQPIKLTHRNQNSQHHNT